MHVVSGNSCLYRPRHRRQQDMFSECVDGPRVMVTERPTRPFTDLVRLQRPGVTRQNWERVRARAQLNQAAAAADDDANISFDRRPASHGLVIISCNLYNFKQQM